ncbi:MAG: GatB/YqeY domain-containing protein [Bacteroidales bacterium]|nr:GatB/YqeY domain-containing protein [Bacteroidales bacterium]
MSLFEQINQDIKTAMLAKEKEKLEALRAIKAAFLIAKTEKGEDQLSAEKEISVIQKLVKQREDSAVIYQQNNRPELAEKEQIEATYIKAYLPKQLSREEIEEVIKNIISSVGASGMKDMGKVMGVASKELAGKADGKTISEIVKQLLA